MKTWIASIAVALIFSGCAQLSAPSPQSTFATCLQPLPKLGTTRHGGPLHVTRTFYLGHTGDVLVAEEASLDNALEFIVGPVSIMNAGFEFQTYRTFDLDRFHDGIEGIGRNGEPVHLVTRSLYEGFLVAYSRNSELTASFQACIMNAIPMPKPNTRAPVLFQNATQSDWSERTFWLHRIARSKFIERF
ncbi:hypothetical protein JWV37_11420 [Sulfurospirillum sp. T05]|uniref:Lipoprotein n=1 Tax=Sulfurospirillum tamanense TaxID=2813362 RepID=A0ABS2WUR8_9BACT|nr:hypothetical protein [Sulfurospirillum tamanensis]MBN2965392.1 hypothetical protein [Sulfurospirillum tamanensis]